MTHIHTFLIPRPTLGRICCWLVFGWSLIWGFPALAADTGNLPDHEKRSTIQEVDGFTYLSEDLTLSQMREQAYASAKRQAVQNAKSYLKSFTHVEDFILKSDEILIDSEGVVSVLESKDLGLEDNARYHVWIKAEVEYQLDADSRPVKGEQAVDSNQPLTVKVWTSKKHYQEGDNVTIFLKGNRDFYARIVDISATGEIVQLLPNDYRSIHAFKGDQLYQIPGDEDKFELKVSPPFGEDQIVVYASEVPLGNVPTESLGQSGLRGYSGTRSALGVKTRGISVVAAGKAASGKNATSQKTGAATAEFYEATWKFSTQP